MLVIRKVVSAAVAVKFPQVPNPAGQAIQARRPEKATRKVRDQEGPPRQSGQEHAKTASAIRLADSMAAFWGRWAWAVGTSHCETWSEATPSPVTVQSPKCPRHLPPVLRLWSRRNDEIGNMGSASNGLLIAPFGSWILFQLSRGLEGHLQLSAPYKCPSLRLPKASGQPRHSGGTLMAVCSSCQSARGTPEASRLPGHIIDRVNAERATALDPILAPSSKLPRSRPCRPDADPGPSSRLQVDFHGGEVAGPHRWTDTGGAWHSDGHCAHWHSPQSLTLTHCFPQQHWIWFRIAACG